MRFYRQNKCIDFIFFSPNQIDIIILIPNQTKNGHEKSREFIFLNALKFLDFDRNPYTIKQNVFSWNKGPIEFRKRPILNGREYKKQDEPSPIN